MVVEQGFSSCVLITSFCFASNMINIDRESHINKKLLGSSIIFKSVEGSLDEKL